MEKLQKGDVVYLKSGSNTMTILEIEENYCKVVWMNKDKKAEYARFPMEALTKKNPDAPIIV